MSEIKSKPEELALNHLIKEYNLEKDDYSKLEKLDLSSKWLTENDQKIYEKGPKACIAHCKSLKLEKSQYNNKI